MCGLTTGNLSVYATRGKIVYSGDYVDDAIDLNLSFLRIRQDKQQSAEKPVKSPKTEQKTPKTVEKSTIPRVFKPEMAKIPAPNVEKPVENGKNYELNTQKMRTQIMKMEMEIEKLRMQSAKFMGEVIPVGLLKPSVLQHNQSILTQSKIMLDNLTRIIVKKFSIPPEEAAEFRGKCIDELNEMVRKATAVTVKSINNIVNDFAAKKNVGQRT